MNFIDLELKQSIKSLALAIPLAAFCLNGLASDQDTSDEKPEGEFATEITDTAAPGDQTLFKVVHDTPQDDYDDEDEDQEEGPVPEASFSLADNDEQDKKKDDTGERQIDLG